MSILSLLYSDGNSIGEIELDVILSEGANSKATLTKNPVAKGADTTDHIRLEPMTFSITGMVSDTPVKLGGTLTNVFKSSGKRVSSDTWGKLLKLQALREPFTLKQNLRSYDNVVIVDLDYTQDKELSNVLLFTCNMSEIILVGEEVAQRETIEEQSIFDKLSDTVNSGRKALGI